jgi:hypothetical protein
MSFTYGQVTNDVLLFTALGYGAAMAGAAKPNRRDVQMQAMSEEVEQLQQVAAG